MPTHTESDMLTKEQTSAHMQHKPIGLNRVMRIGLLASIGKTIDAFFPEMIAHWRESGHYVAIAAGTPGAKVKVDVIRELSRRPKLKNLRAPSAIDAWAAHHNLDAIITNTAVASFLSRARRSRVPVIYFCHGLHWNRGNKLNEHLWRALESFALKNTAGVITINRDDQKWFATRLPDRKRFHSRSGVGVPLTNYSVADVDLESDRTTLTWIGELSKRKRPLLAVEVASHVTALGAHVRLRMYGNGPLEREVAERIQQLELTDSVTLEGWTSSPGEALAKSHALLHTAAWEGLPRVALEALAVGRRTYAFDVKGVRDIPEISLAPDSDAKALAVRIVDDWRTGNIELNIDLRDELRDTRVATEIIAFSKKIVNDHSMTEGVS